VLHPFAAAPRLLAPSAYEAPVTAHVHEAEAGRLIVCLGGERRKERFLRAQVMAYEERIDTHQVAADQAVAEIPADAFKA
jgi:3-hydroxyisobutyrate dehydrogenase-like beta-hydroxyacid dehydrogenase